MQQTDRECVPADDSAVVARVWQEAIETHRAGNLVQAVSLYRACLEARPESAETYYMLGLCFVQLQAPQQAETCLAAAVRLRPGDPVLLRSHGNALKVMGRHEEALSRYDAALALRPDYADAHRSRGILLKVLGRPREALAAYDAAIAARPDYADAHASRANLLAECGQLDEALAGYERTLVHNPDFAEAYNNRGIIFSSQGRPREAILSYCKAISLQRDYPEAYNNRGIVLKSLGKYDMALQDYNTALSLRPHYPEAFNNRGNVLKERQQLDAALADYNRAIELRPDYPEAHNNRAVLFTDLGLREQALVDYDRAIALKPDYGEAHFNRALCHLQMGRFAAGWAGYEWRWRNPNLRMPPRPFSQPQWRGAEELTGRTILLHSEQGLGDTLQFCRYVPLVAARGARVVLELDWPLIPLLAGLDGVSEIIPRGQPLPPFDLHCPLLSLPMAFGTDLDSIPAAPSYLAVDPARLERWRARLGPATRPRIGLVWSGNGNHRNDPCRSLSLALVRPLIEERFEFLCLHKDIREVELVQAAETRGLRLFCDEIHDFADTAALCLLADLVISVDTSVAHLAGALGRPCWVLLPYNSDWRWLLERTDSPWYPSLRLYRQGAEEGVRGDWGGVLDALRADLATRFPR